MIKSIKILAAVAAGILALGCTKDEVQLSLSDKVVNFDPADHLEKTVKVTCNDNWTVLATESWITVSPTSGSGSGSFKITVSANTALAQRTADVKVSAGTKSETVKVTQLGVEPVVELTPSKADFEADGGEKEITVISNLEWTLSIPEADTWLTATPANDKKSFKITAQPNTNLEARTSTVTVSVEGKSAKVAVAQQGLNPSLAVSPAELDIFSREGGNVEINVTANVEWVIEIPETDTWIKADILSGEKNGKVKLTIEPNNTALESRTSEVTFRLKEHEISSVIAITQEAAVYNIETDKLALLAIYEASDGANWAKNKWDLTQDVSTWSGVTVTNGRVTALKITASGVIVKDWTLPDEVGWLTEVTDFRINQNHLTGALPESLFTLTKLQKLYFQNNTLSGSLSSSIANLKELTEFYIDRNTNLTGDLSWIGSLTKLVSINIAKTSIGGAIPESLVNCTALKNFMAYGNKLSGQIPDFWDQLPSVGVLQLYDNPDITGPIPASLGHLQLATGIQLKNCNLTGNIPESFGDLPKCGNLQLNNNKLSGVVPAAVQAHAKWGATTGWKYETNILPQQDGYGLKLQ